MQLVLPWFSPGRRVSRSEQTPSFLEIGPRTYPVSFTRHRRARRYVLRMTSEGALRITVPHRASIAGGLAFAKGQGAWVAREHARRVVQAGAWADGRLVWFRGEQVPLVIGESSMAFGAETMPRPSDANKIRDVFEKHLRAMAIAELPPRCAELAKRHGLTVSRVSVRNQRSRWGSCSSRGTIALNWRLMQMSAEVSDYVILHELMHLRQPNHSRQFWREVASVCDGWREAERWLRANGTQLL